MLRGLVLPMCLVPVVHADWHSSNSGAQAACCASLRTGPARSPSISQMCSQLTYLQCDVQVKAAYKKLSLKHHPDVAAPEDRQQAEETFKSLGVAYQQALKYEGALPAVPQELHLTVSQRPEGSHA